MSENDPWYEGQNNFTPQTIGWWSDKIHKTAVEKGWWREDRNYGEMIALMHSELSESLEAWRDDVRPFWMEGEKPEGWAVELADCMIRIMDTCQALGVNLENLIRLKVAYNETRPYRHGGKRA